MKAENAGQENVRTENEESGNAGLEDDQKMLEWKMQYCRMWDKSHFVSGVKNQKTILLCCTVLCYSYSVFIFLFIAVVLSAFKLLTYKCHTLIIYYTTHANI